MVLPFLAAIAPFAPLIGGAISAVGSLLAPKPKPQTQTVNNSIDLLKLRDDAEAAGFNPLTIIRGGGLAGYGTSTQTISAAADYRLSNALQTFGSGVAQWQYDPYGELKSQAELRLAEAQIASYARQGAPDNLSFQAPKAAGVQSSPSFSGNPYTFFGLEVQPNPFMSDAQAAEDRHGDLVSAVWGLGTVAADAGKWLYDASYDFGRAVGQALWRAQNADAEHSMNNGMNWGPVTNRPLEITVRGGAN